ncbi:putative transcriptional regulator [Gelidibacter algens]|uniref:Putative transcriptional regulator n=2 Tax=Gelidibacter algens TaxID=49280 RepID=A0A327RRP8_9FLAO|nr:putative transcriptional regulator [Gelidibacter algens]
MTSRFNVPIYANEIKLIFMQKLTNKEEEIMHIIWKLEKAFVKDVLAEITADQPHYNTLSTIVRNLEDKGYVSYQAYGKTHQYFPIVSKEAYKKRFMSTAIENYFNNSYKNVVSFFAKEEKISIDELKEIIALIETKNNEEAESKKSQTL